MIFDPAMRNARVCYNHLAGNKGIQLHNSLLASRYLALKSGDLTLSDCPGEIEVEPADQRELLV